MARFACERRQLILRSGFWLDNIMEEIGAIQAKMLKTQYIILPFNF